MKNVFILQYLYFILHVSDRSIQKSSCYLYLPNGNSSVGGPLDKDVFINILSYCPYSKLIILHKL